MGVASFEMTTFHNAIERAENFEGGTFVSGVAAVTAGVMGGAGLALTLGVFPGVVAALSVSLLPGIVVTSMIAIAFSLFFSVFTIFLSLKANQAKEDWIRLFFSVEGSAREAALTEEEERHFFEAIQGMEDPFLGVCALAEQCGSQVATDALYQLNISGNLPAQGTLHTLYTYASCASHFVWTEMFALPQPLEEVSLIGGSLAASNQSAAQGEYRINLDGVYGRCQRLLRMEEGEKYVQEFLLANDPEGSSVSEKIAYWLDMGYEVNWEQLTFFLPYLGREHYLLWDALYRCLLTSRCGEEFHNEILLYKIGCECIDFILQGEEREDDGPFSTVWIKLANRCKGNAAVKYRFLLRFVSWQIESLNQCLEADTRRQERRTRITDWRDHFIFLQEILEGLQSQNGFTDELRARFFQITPNLKRASLVQNVLVSFLHTLKDREGTLTLGEPIVSLDRYLSRFQIVCALLMREWPSSSLRESDVFGYIPQDLSDLERLRSDFEWTLAERGELLGEEPREIMECYIRDLPIALETMHWIANNEDGHSEEIDERLQLPGEDRWTSLLSSVFLTKMRCGEEMDERVREVMREYTSRREFFHLCREPGEIQAERSIGAGEESAPSSDRSDEFIDLEQINDVQSESRLRSLFIYFTQTNQEGGHRLVNELDAFRRTEGLSQATQEAIERELSRLQDVLGVA